MKTDLDGLGQFASVCFQYMLQGSCSQIGKPNSIYAATMLLAASSLLFSPPPPPPPAACPYQRACPSIELPAWRRPAWSGCTSLIWPRWTIFVWTISQKPVVRSMSPTASRHFPHPLQTQAAITLLCHPAACLGQILVCLVQDDLPKVDRLLLEAYSQISEPDSIYAVARSPSLAVQLPLAEHEGSWAEALVSHDLLMHHSAPEVGQLPTPTSQAPNSHGSQYGGGRQQQGLFNALQQLGCQHILQKLYLSESQQSGKTCRSCSGLMHPTGLAVDQPAVFLECHCLDCAFSWPTVHCMRL